MFTAPKNKFLVPFDKKFSITDFNTNPPQKINHKQEKEYKKELAKVIKKLSKLQKVLFAEDKHSILLIFQAMDAAGKDSTIRAVMSGINPAGCQVYGFKRPSNQELDHDFLWRTYKCLPERGRIGIFNRSYYEEVLVVKVHPEILKYQKLPEIRKEKIWQERYNSIASQELHLANNGTIILKFWLNVSLKEQKSRLLERLNNPEKYWKFEKQDLIERKLWPKYMQAYEDVLKATSTSYAPWYALPADNKPYMRLQVAKILVEALSSLNMKYPKVSEGDKKHFENFKKQLKNEK